jgi:uncharacterized protein YlxP (DUF503 family)
MSDAFVALLRIELHFPAAHSLKAKRSELQSVKAHLHQRLGAAVAEVDHQDLWQRATLAAALCSSSPAHLERKVDGLEAWLDARYPQGVAVQRTLASWEDLRGVA